MGIGSNYLPQVSSHIDDRCFLVAATVLSFVGIALNSGTGVSCRFDLSLAIVSKSSSPSLSCRFVIDCPCCLTSSSCPAGV